MPPVPLEHRLTPAQIEKICTGLKACLPMELLFLQEGIPRRTYYDCKKRLEDCLLAESEGQPYDPRTHAVALQIFQAWAEGGLDNVRELVKLGDKNQRWQHRAWVAERSWWQVFGRRWVLEDQNSDSSPAGDTGTPKAGETDGLDISIRLSRLRSALQREAHEVQADRPSEGTPSDSRTPAQVVAHRKKVDDRKARKERKNAKK